jgi:pimeloyl-ACP methyl ester carboxylesterase
VRVLHSKLPALLPLLVAVLLIGGIAYGAGQLPALGAGGLLHPARRPVIASAPDGCRDVRFAGAGVTLDGWRCQAVGARRGALVYLHGVADNRASGTGVIDRFRRQGFEVVAYDSRAHGASGGDACTYGFFEKDDLRRVVDTLEPGPVVLVGASLGAAVALLATADDPRVSAVVAAETFSDLRSVARDRVPFFFTDATVARAFDLAEERGRFDADAVSPVRAAARIVAPVLLIHGDADVDTPPGHSRRVFAALRGRKRLHLVPGATHNNSLRGDVWPVVEQWLDQVLSEEPRRSARNVGRVINLLISERATL